MRESSKGGESMAVYAVVNVRVTDPNRYAEYRAKAPDTISHYGGKYLARGGAVEVLEGNWEPQRLVILEFESMERFKEWYKSPEYALGMMLRSMLRSTARRR